MSLWVPLFSPWAWGSEKEISSLKELIKITEETLAHQKKLLNKLSLFEEARATFLADTGCRKGATQLVHAAMDLYQEVESSQLSYLFPPDFLEEVTFFQQIGQRQKLKTLAPGEA